MRRSAAPWRARPLVLALGLAGAGCGAPPPVAVEVPAEVAWVAALRASAGTLDGPAPRAWAADAPLPVTRSGGDEILLLGWTAAELAALGLDGPEAVASIGRLRVAEATEPGLPPPHWAARWDEGQRLLAVPVDGLPRLSGPGLEGRCRAPELESLRVDAVCDLPRCEVRARRVGACAARLELQDCGLDPITVVAELDGPLRVIGSGADASWACEDAPPDAEADGAARCGGPRTCDLHVYRDPERRAPQWTVEHHTLVESPPSVPARLDEVGLFYNDALATGVLGGLAVLDDRVLVLMGADATPRPPCPDGPERGPNRIAVVELDSMRTVRTGTVGRCAERLVARADGDGAFTTAHEGGRLYALRLDRDGRERRRVELRRGDARVRDLRVEPDGRLVVLGVSHGGPTWLLRLDADTLALDDAWEDGRLSGAWHAVPFEDARGRGYVILHDGDRSIVWFDAARWTAGEELSLPPDAWTGAAVFGGHYDRGLDRLFFGGRGQFELYAVDGRGRRVSGRGDFARESALTAAHPWPKAGTWLRSTTEMGTWISRAGRLDAEGVRLLPGEVVLGHGPAASWQLDGAGRWWATLPWSGALLRLSAE